MSAMPALTLPTLTILFSLLPLATECVQQKLERRVSLNYSPSLTVAAVTRLSVTSRLACAYLCSLQPASQCLALTYSRLNGNCTVYFYPPGSAPPGFAATSQTLSGLAPSPDLEVWSDTADSIGGGGVADTTTTTAATTTANVLPVSANYSGGSLAKRNGTIHFLTVSVTGCYSLTVIGAVGGNCTVSGGGSAFTGGLGASVSGDFLLSAGQQVALLAGQPGSAATSAGGSNGGGGGGGGGSFVWLTESSGSTSRQLLVAAGGGGGASAMASGVNATGGINGSHSAGLLNSVAGAGGVNGSAGSAGSRISNDVARGGPGAGWLGSASAAALVTVAGDASPGLSGNQSWLGGGPGGFEGGFGGGGAGSVNGSAGGGGGFSGGGSGGAYADAGGAGGSVCYGKNCVALGAANPSGGGLASIWYLADTCP